jgi:hypothetical protein
MSQLVKNGETKTEKIQNETLDGVNFGVVLSKIAHADLMTAKWVSLAAIFVRIILVRKGVRHDIVTGNLKALVIESALNSSVLGMALENGEFVSMTDETMGNAEMGLLPLRVNFGAVLNLRGDDCLEVETSIEPSFINRVTYPNHRLDENRTFVMVTSNEAVGVETHIPFIQLSAITNSDNRIQKNLGSSVTSVSLISLDSTGFGYNKKIVKNVTLKADKIYLNDDFEALITKQFNAFDTLGVANKRAQNFNIYSGVELDQCSLDLSLHEDRVVAGKNWIVWRYFYTDASMLKLAQVTQELHTMENLAKVGVSVSGSASASTLQSQKTELLKA